MNLRLYNRISLVFLNLRFIIFILFLLLQTYDVSYFIEWSLGGSYQLFTLRFVIDYIASLFLSVVFFISSNVVKYRQSYMSNDANADRFILLVLRFVISIIFLITSPNIITILLGWDGLGLTSYALVIYYPTKKSSRAGILTVIRNRVGDVCILISISWFSLIGDYNYLIWINSGFLDSISWLSFLVVLAALTKSAQIPFSAWLPAAIAAPTPVSALVHSSTLVTAGVYLLIRFGGFNSGFMRSILFHVSVLTIFISGLVAVYEYDLKKVIALSTLRQLGVIIFSISLGLFKVAFFHLIIHALFKAILFLCAGAMIHGVGGSQDMRHYGGQVRSYPVIGACLNIANLSLCGVPFISGFYSKDLIVELAAQNSWNIFLIFLRFISLGLTVMYSVRLVYLRIVSHENGGPFSIVCDPDWVIVLPIVTLALISLISGASISWLLFLDPSLILLPYYLKLGAIAIVSLSVILSYSITCTNLPIFNFNNLLIFNGLIWFLPLLSGQSISRESLKTGVYLLNTLDQGWLESIRVGTINFAKNKYTQTTYLLQTNSLKNHFLVFSFWLIIILIFMM